MPLVHQAEFARLHGVSRKAVTTWKQRKYLVMEAGLIDVDASNLKLSQAGRAWPQTVTTAAKPAEGNETVSALPTRPAVDLDGDYDWQRQNGCGVGVPDAVACLGVVAASATSHMAELVLRHLPPDVVLPLLDEFFRKGLFGAVSLADESDLAPPKGMRTWGQHPVFDCPAMSLTEWEEVQQLAAAWRAKAATAS